jgi:hypothetical protein
MCDPKYLECLHLNELDAALFIMQHPVPIKYEIFSLLPNPIAPSISQPFLYIQLTSRVLFELVEQEPYG